MKTILIFLIILIAQQVQSQEVDIYNFEIQTITIDTIGNNNGNIDSLIVSFKMNNSKYLGGFTIEYGFVNKDTCNIVGFGLIVEEINGINCIKYPDNEKKLSFYYLRQNFVRLPIKIINANLLTLNYASIEPWNNSGVYCKKVYYKI